MLDKAEARDAISKLIYGYAEALDGGDLERVGAFFEHAVIHAAAGEIRGAEGAREMYRAWTVLYDEQGRPSDWGRPGATPHTRHLTSNLMIDVADDGRSAAARCSVVVFMSLPGFPLQPILRGGYRDRFECADGRWRFAERVMLVDDVGDLSRHLLQKL
jgi:3-phenylpropionate/cinnamic acid dioxygenase small subunit